MTKRIPKIPAAEWDVMEVLWREPGLTGVETHARLKHSGRALNTVNTLLSRLVERGALSAEREGRAFRYTPLLDRDTCVRKESVGFVRRVLGGQWSPLMLNLVREAELNETDIRELEDLLRRKREESKS